VLATSGFDQVHRASFDQRVELAENAAPVIGNYDYQPLRTDLVQSELLNGLALSNGGRFRLDEYPEVILESYR
jgi:hypothetical protein